MTQVPPPTVPPPPPPPPGSYSAPPPSATSGGDRTIMIVLSYLWILALIPLLVKKDDREVQWHAKNGLAITVAEIVVAVLFWILGMALGDSLGLGCGLGAISCVISIGFLVVRILGIVKGVNNQRFRLPVISDFADKM
jgi:uncharacterized membrane protein